MKNTGVPETPDGFRNLKTSLTVMRCFHADSHHAQCCLVFSWDGNYLSALITFSSLP